MTKPPDKVTKGDIVHTVVKAAASAIPVAGGPAAILFEEVFRKPIEVRRQKWLEMLAEAVEELKQKVENLENKDLSENQAFISSVMQASQVAQRTHQEEKLEALRNAIQNAALPHSPDEDTQQVFLRFIDELTPWHLRILDLFDGPEEWARRNKVKFPEWGMGGGSTVLEFAFADLRGRRDFYDQVVSDLQVRGLLPQGAFLHTTMSGGAMIASRTTTMGKQFLKFIRKPF
jgi:polyhydroxyalkanoate synthesis regulator phasin